MNRGARFSVAEKSWLMYDWANSIYATNIMAAIFPIYFTSLLGQNTQGIQLWGYGTALATLAVAIMGPIFGAIADCKGMKKRFWLSFVILGVVFTASMAIFDQWQLLLVGYVFSFIGFEGSCLFYDSMLTDVTEPERMDKVSAWGYATGYFGGSTLGFIISIGIMFWLGMENPVAVKIVIAFTSIWWALFSIPLLLKVKQTHYIEKTPLQVVRDLPRHLTHTARSIFANKALFFFMLAYFCYIDGVGTIINMATSYGKTLGLGTTGMILALVVTQVVAVPFSIMFGKLARRFGGIRMISVAIIVYFFICIAGFYMGYSVETANGSKAAIANAQTMFWVMAFMVGTVQGGIQSLSRAQFGKMVPPERSNEFFGFFGVFGKFATVVGPLIVAGVTQLTGRSSLGILGLIVLFALGLFFLWSGRKHFSTV